MNLEILEITGILSFFGGAIVFFINTGAYKKNVEKDIEILKKEIKEQNEELKNQKKDIEKLRYETTNNTARVEALLIEVKTKLELIMQVSGLFKTNRDE